MVGSTELNQVLSEGRAAIASEMRQRLQDYLESYGTGINIVHLKDNNERLYRICRLYT